MSDAGFGPLFERLEGQLDRMEQDSRAAIRAQAETGAKLDGLIVRVGEVDARLRVVEAAVNRQGDVEPRVRALEASASRHDGAKEGGGGTWARGFQILQGGGVLVAIVVALWARCPGG